MRERKTINAAATILLINNAYGMLDQTQDSNFTNDI